MQLIEPLAEEQLHRQYTPILSPLIWDLGHIANFEELWLVQNAGGLDPLDGELGRLYDAIENPRPSRDGLPILRGKACLSYMHEVRERSLAVLDEADLEDPADPLLHDGFAYQLVIAHEQQHNETMLQLLQMVEGYEPSVRDLALPRALSTEDPKPAMVEAGSHEIGAPPGGFAYDNERPRHGIELPAFLIDRAPVTNAAFAAFVADTGAEPPMYWEADGSGGFLTTAFGRREPIDPALPVIHVDCRQAEDFARWAGKRLPTELEWEAAARAGALEGVGAVWEWTASEFDGYPGFSAFPYREYSQPFFRDGYRVLRGASWATHPNVARPSFRNWDHPERRQIFAGLRCAQDA